MFASLALLAGLAAALVMVSRSARGRADWSDALYPLLLLHWGHFGTLLVSGQLHVAVVTALAGLILVIIAGDHRRFAVWRTAGAISTAPSSPAPVPAGEGRKGRWALILIGIALLLWSAGELLGQASVVTGPRHWVESVAEFLAMGVGSVGRQWPVPVGGLIALGLIGGASMLFRRSLKQPGEWPRLFGLLAWAGCFAFLAFWEWPQTPWRRPVTLAALGPCWIMLILAIYGRTTFAKFIPRLATLAALGLLWPWPLVIDRGYLKVKIETNTSEGLEQGQKLKKQFEAMRSDIDAGLPEMVIVYRYSRLPNLAEGLSLLREHKIGMFAALRPAPDWQRLPADRVATESPKYHFTFAGGRHIYGAWVKVQPVAITQPVTFEMRWKPLRASSWDSYPTTVRAGNVEDVLVWIDQTIAEANIQCDENAVRVVGIDFLIPRGPAVGHIQ
jgi:hypothetical protein